MVHIAYWFDIPPRITEKHIEFDRKIAVFTSFARYRRKVPHTGTLNILDLDNEIEERERQRDREIERQRKTR